MTLSTKPNPESISKGEWARFIFVAGRLCIDFTQTGGETGIRAYWERLHRPSDLADWFSASPLNLQNVQVTLEDFRMALALRESIWRVAQAIRRNETPIAADVEVINLAAAAPDLPPQFNSDGFQQVWLSPAIASAVLSLIARDAIDLFAGEFRSRIRECENPNCGLMFVDTSRPGKRRWCLMKRCGNIAKTSRYRGKKSLDEKGNQDE
jgi:predicted RNA-binding Zn ribbon-like protein